MGVQFTPPPPAAVSRILSAFDRDQLSGFIAVAIDLLDLADGDADIEPGGDESDASWLEGQGGRDPMRGGAGIEDAEQDDDPEDDDPREMTALNGSQWWDRTTKGTDDDEDEPDRCPAGEDMLVAGPAIDRGHWLARDLARCWSDLRPGSEDDAEADRPPAYRIDQSAPLFLHAENDA